MPRLFFQPLYLRAPPAPYRSKEGCFVKSRVQRTAWPGIGHTVARRRPGWRTTWAQRSRLLEAAPTELMADASPAVQVQFDAETGNPLADPSQVPGSLAEFLPADATLPVLRRNSTANSALKRGQPRLVGDSPIRVRTLCCSCGYPFELIAKRNDIIHALTMGAARCNVCLFGYSRADRHA
jgi:hypothetical protein